MAANPEFRHNMPQLPKLLQAMQNLQNQSEPATLPKKLSLEELLTEAYNCQSAASAQLAIMSESTDKAAFAYSETERLQLLRDWQSLSFLLSKAVHCTGNLENYFFTKKQLQNALLVIEQLDGNSRPFEADCYKYLIGNYERLAKTVTADGCVVIALEDLADRLENLKRNLATGG